MLQVWKIEVPAPKVDCRSGQGWALAESEEEARTLSGYSTALVIQEPERLWVAKERMIWTRQPQQAYTESLDTNSE